MPRRLKAVPDVLDEHTPHGPKFSVSELRVMLAEAESRERSEIERLRMELDMLRAERSSAAIVADPAVGLPRALVSTARSLPPVLNVAEAATALRVSEPTIRSWVKTGKLTAGQTTKRGRIRIPRDAVLAVLSSPDSV